MAAGATCPTRSAGSGGRSAGRRQSRSQSATGSRCAAAGRRLSVRVEALAAYATWLANDTAVNIDPAGKLQLLAELDWLRTVLRGGEHAFDPQTDRPAFDRYLASIDAHPPYMGQTGNNQPVPARGPQQQRDRRELARALAAIKQRLAELKQREHALRAAIDSPRDGTHAGRDLAELERTVAELKARQRELSRQLDQDA